jgi:urease accessory protein
LAILRRAEGRKAVGQVGREAQQGRIAELALLHLCDSAFPLGAFAYSDGLEAAASDRRVASTSDLRSWVDACLDESIGRMEGPAVWQAWAAVADRDWHTLELLDEELTALRPSSSARRSTRAMGSRLLTTWQALHPDRRLAQVVTRAHEGRLAPVLPIAFAAACACAGIERRRAVDAFAYTRLAATIFAAMRVMPLGQSDAHAVLARTLDRAPAVVDRIVERDARVESFSPALDIEMMRQLYLPSRLFQS